MNVLLVKKVLEERVRCDLSTAVGLKVSLRTMN